jgi:hypothetical protein
MSMKCYGYEDDDRDRPLLLREVTLLVDPNTLRRLARFFNECADQIEGAGSDWEHEHYSERFPEEEIASDIIVFNAAREADGNG